MGWFFWWSYWACIFVYNIKSMKSNLNILIVEDEYINAQLIEQSVENLGHKVTAITSNAQDSYDVVKKSCIDLIFMDINLEGSIDGISCAKKLNQYKNIPIIYTTAYSDTNTIKEASQTNIYGYLIKPFDDRDIEATLNVAIASIEKNRKELGNIIDLKNCYIYSMDTKLFTINGEIIPLTKKEKELLEFLIKNSNNVISYDLFRQIVWNDKIVADSTIREIILRLRKKAPLLHIENIVGLGYIFKND